MKKRHQANRRDPGGFIQIPHAVYESAAYKGLSLSATKLLWDVVFQYRGNNNGRLLPGWRIMSEDKGWTSRSALARAKAELLESKLLFETRKGARPNKSTWCAATWWHLDWTVDMDIKEQDFPRGAYRDLVSPAAIKINALSPLRGQADAA